MNIHRMSIRHVLLRLLVVLVHAVLTRHQTRVRTHARHAVDLREDRSEHVRVVVRHLALQNGRQTLETHARVHVARGKQVQLAARVARVLHKHQVPDLDHVRIVLVDQRRRIASADAIVVDLGAYV